MRLWTGLVLLGLLVGTAVAAQQATDVLYLQDGRERVGELVRVTADDIIFHVAGEAAATTFPKSQVERIDLTRAREGDQVRRVEDLQDPLLERLIAEQPAKFAYPDSGHVVLYRIIEYTLAEDASYTVRERCVEKVLLERGKDRANVARYFRRGDEKLKIDFARTVNPDGSVTPISDAAVETSSFHADTPEYEKLYQTKFAMKQVKEGSLLDYQFTRERASSDVLFPMFASQLYRGSEPILETELRIHVPRSMKLLHREDHIGDNYEFTCDEQADHVTYRFVARDCPRVVPESNMPPADDFYPRVAAGLDATWDAIGAAYGRAMNESWSASDEIRAKVAELTVGVDSPDERARRIYHYFIGAVRQLWVSPMEYQYAPRPAADVFAKRAGNSIDKALLLCVMLDEAGLRSGMVLVRPQGAGRLLEDVPSIRQFSVALAAVRLPGGWQYLPVTDESVRFGQMPSSYQGTRGLLVERDSNCLVDIPLHEAADELEAVAYDVRVTPQGDLVVVKEETLTGNAEVQRRNAWKDLKEEELRRRLEMSLTAAHPKTRLDDYTVENLHDVTRPLKFTQKYTLEDYAMRAGDELLVFQLPEVEYGASSVGKPTRDFPLRWWQRSRATTAMRIEVPPGFRVHYAGRDYATDCGIMSFAATFTSAGNEIRYEDEFVQDEIEAPRDAYGDYKRSIETRARVSKEWIVLERVTE